MQNNSDAEYLSWHEIIEDNAQRIPEKVAIHGVDSKSAVTFKFMRDVCNRFANFLKDRGLTEKDKVTVIGNNTIETLVIYFGTLKYGAIVNPIFEEESPDNIDRIIRMSKPRIVIYDGNLHLDKENYSDAEWIPYGEGDLSTSNKSLFSLLPGFESAFDSHLGHQDNFAENIFTSGTTDLPKGILITRKALYKMAVEVADRIGLTENDRILEYRAYNWLSAQGLSILSSMITGATLYFGKKFSRSRFFDWLKGHHITISAGVPAVFSMLLNEPVPFHKRDVSALKFITSSSAPLRVEDHVRFEETYGIPINQMMGMSEAGWMAGNPPERRKIGSVGVPFKYKRIHFVNENGQRCTVGEVGEMFIAGASMGLGYLQEDGTINAFPEDGFPTGDLGYMDEDGYIYITGRKKDLIIRGGINISPMEITSRIMDHPSVAEAATVGAPDKIYGEEVVSFVALKTGCDACEDDIISHCKMTLPEFKVPKRIIFMAELPRNERRKVSKPELMKLLEWGTSGI